MLRRWLQRGLAAGSFSLRLRPPAAQRPSSQNPLLYRLVNQDRATILAEQVRLAGGSVGRRSGLRRRASLPITEGLAIAPCEAIHTFGMRFPIDVVFLDTRYRIRRLVERLKPNRIAVCFAAALAVELSSGALRRSHSSTGDVLRFELIADEGRSYADRGQADFEDPGTSAEERPLRMGLP